MQSDLSSTSLVAGSHIDPVAEQSAGDSVSVLDDDNGYVRKYRGKWVSESARQEWQELIIYF